MVALTYRTMPGFIGRPWRHARKRQCVEEGGIMPKDRIPADSSQLSNRVPGLKRSLLLIGVSALATGAFAAPAYAQDTTPPSSTPVPPNGTPPQPAAQSPQSQ